MSVSVISGPSGRLFSTEQGDVASRVDALATAAANARGRLDDTLLADADAIVEQAGSRLRLSSEHTIVALAGATGSGKSSLFNSLTGIELAGVGVRRPTTSWALACAWGPEGSAEILEWLGIPQRHQVSRTSMLDSSSDDTNLEGLVLLDLPDHDSTEVSHHLEVDRLVTHADLLVWILDPQKYADAAVHERYLRPLASHGDVTMVVLNQIDKISTDQWSNALEDVRKLLVEDGLPDVPVLGVSATRGDGVDDLKRALVMRIRDKKSAKERLDSDVGSVAARLAAVSGTTPAVGINEADRSNLDATLAESAGVPVVVDAIEKSTSRRASRSTRWPASRWLGRLRADPLKRLHVKSDPTIDALVRSSVPAPTKVQRASVDVAVRDLADKASSGLAEPWAKAIRDASSSQESDLVDALDQAMARTDLKVTRRSWWWVVVNLLQWVLFAAAVVGLLWLVVLAAMTFMRLDAPSVPSWLGVPAPTLLLVAGVVLGLVVAVLSRVAARRSGRRKARRADALLRDAISEVAQRQVITPMLAELEAYETTRAALATATSSPT